MASNLKESTGVAWITQERNITKTRRPTNLGDGFPVQLFSPRQSGVFDGTFIITYFTNKSVSTGWKKKVKGNL